MRTVNKFNMESDFEASVKMKWLRVTIFANNVDYASFRYKNKENKTMVIISSWQYK